MAIKHPKFTALLSLLMTKIFSLYVIISSEVRVFKLNKMTKIVMCLLAPLLFFRLSNLLFFLLCLFLYFFRGLRTNQYEIMLSQIQKQFPMFPGSFVREAKLNPVQNCKFYNFICRVCIKISGFQYQRLILIILRSYLLNQA